jgi:PIN domain nuclease of toxin-antitoxin system
MRVLLDAHFAFWFALRRDRLKPEELAFLGDRDNELFVSSVTIWELRIKWEKHFVSGERKGEANPADVLNVLRLMEVIEIDLDSDIAVAILIEPIKHQDPFDELMLIIAQERDMLLLTRDRNLRKHPLVISP